MIDRVLWFVLSYFASEYLSEKHGFGMVTPEGEEHGPVPPPRMSGPNKQITIRVELLKPQT